MKRREGVGCVVMSVIQTKDAVGTKKRIGGRRRRRERNPIGKAWRWSAHPPPFLYSSSLSLCLSHPFPSFLSISFFFVGVLAPSLPLQCLSVICVCLQRGDLFWNRKVWRWVWLQWHGLKRRQRGCLFYSFQRSDCVFHHWNAAYGSEKHNYYHLLGGNL